jgi:hypothetical protein
MDGDDLLVLRGLANAIKDGAVSIDAAFPENTAAEAAKRVGAIKAKPNGDSGSKPTEAAKEPDKTAFQLHAKAIEEAETAPEVDRAKAAVFDDERVPRGDRARLSSLAEERLRQLAEAAEFGKAGERERHEATK